MHLMESTVDECHDELLRYEYKDSSAMFSVDKSYMQALTWMSCAYYVQQMYPEEHPSSLSQWSV